MASSGLLGMLNSLFWEKEVIWLFAFCSVSKSEDFRKSCTISYAGEKGTVFLETTEDFVLVNEKHGLLVPQ